MGDTTSKGRLLTLPEIAEMTRMPEGTLRFWRHQGRLPFTFRLGTRVVAYEADVQDWIDQQQHQSTVKAS